MKTITLFYILISSFTFFIFIVVLSSAAKPGTHFLENNKIIGVFTMLKLCVSKERNM